MRPVVLAGNISSPDLGLTKRDAQWVADNCSTVVHSAASLTFYHDPKTNEPQRSNVEGTRHVIDFCRRAGIRQYHHVSTAYVCGRRRGRILETELDLGQEPSNDYEQAKLTSEKEVLASGAFDQITVHRPSIIIGDSRTGHTTSYHGFYTPLRLVHSLVTTISWQELLTGDFLGTLQLGGEERKNLVPVDWVSAAMAAVITRPELHGRTYHFTNPRPVTAVMMQEAIVEALSELSWDQPAKAAPKVSTSEFLEGFHEQMKVYQSYWSDDPEFDSTITETALPELPCPVVDREMMLRLVRYAINTNFGWPRERRRCRRSKWATS